jgi:hypothetical protein
MQQKPTTSEMAEGLIPYDPVIPVDAKWVISHRYRVAGIKGILTSSTILESTSQILAYGLDLFGSSVSPSGRFDVLSRDFNKLQLIGTTLGLAAAIGILRPIVSNMPFKRMKPSTSPLTYNDYRSNAKSSKSDGTLPLEGNKEISYIRPCVHNAY